ncbi:hypothetical protein RD792_012111 [Penstemon davidsonii]|uniref:RING-type E3 ubiquitin transferase n=1 Tax=Penstemon davidsonii TaxID=160366 RepID=A0ABR0CXD4_9LAMI|nr:hypothetical protein RD792_012111 [Penstemon davidsonii]
MSATASTSSQILHHTTAFLSETLSQPELRHHLFSTFLQTLPSKLTKPLNFASQTVENAISTTIPSIRSSSLRLAEKLLLSNSNNSFSSFLLSLIYSLCNRTFDASLNLLDVFYIDPPLARLEIAPFLFQELFLIHFNPILDWYNEERLKILSSLSLSYGYNSDDERSIISTTTCLSKISGDQAIGLKDLERDHEDLLDFNCRIFVEYFKQVLRNNDAEDMIVPPLILLRKPSEGDHDDDDDDKVVFSDEVKIKTQEFGSTNRRSLDSSMEDVNKSPGGGKHAPPKDFVCPITTHIFNDPVTLETGQTYERRAIQEWIDRGNSSCPITRQNLISTHLPKTNYVLKRLIASWQEKNPSSPKLKPEKILSVSPNSVISQATIDGTMSELRVSITNLCTSEILKEAEMAVLKIERFWIQANIEIEMQSLLSKPPVINGLVEILFNSVDTQVLKSTVLLLSELASRDENVIQTLTRVDSDVECVIELFKKGLLEAVVLVYLLRPTVVSLIEMDIVDYLLVMLSNREDDDFPMMCINPKTAALILLGDILRNSSEESLLVIVRSIVSTKTIDKIVASLKAKQVNERIAAVSILLRCILEDGKCRNIVADKAELAFVLESFAEVNDGEQFEIVHFLSELVKLNRRNLNEQILHFLKDEGTFSTMHTLLIYLQNSLHDQSPIVAGLLLQLDLLDEPRKMSIYREEAIDTLISCLRNSEFPVTQISAAETILSLQGRFSYSGKSLARAILLKRAGLDRNYKAFMRKDQRRQKISADAQDTMEEEKASEEWERKVAFVLVSHEFGLLFEALAEGLKSKYEELHSICFMASTWLVYMLSILPDTGIRGAARVCLLKHFVIIFRSEKNTDDRVLSLLALNTFIRDPEGLHDLTPHMKDILKDLRELKKSSALAFQMLKVFSEEHDNSADIWNHKEISQEDCSINGEVLAITCFKAKVFSGHSDGTIKVWRSGVSELHLVQEIREHTKPVTSLAILHSSEKLYSGSLDRTIRVYTLFFYASSAP